MKTVGLITEYNPFHSGHAYHIKKAKELTGADYAVAVMSGDFVQRGTPALLEKHTRARMALLGGADLVLELPVPYATASAEMFAYGSIRILNSLGVIDTVCFGCECGDAEPLMEIARIFASEPDWYREALQKNLKKGFSFPAARAAALPDFSEILNRPNNILGIEYCKALLRSKSQIKPLGIKRKGNAYHETSLNDSFASASALREKLLENCPSCDKYCFSQWSSKSARFPQLDRNLDAISGYFPEKVFEVLKNSLSESDTMSENDFSEILVYRLMMAGSTEDFCQYADMSEDLAARVFKNRNNFRSFSQFADLMKTREVTRTRINRALLHLILNIKKDSVAEPYARVLGFRKDAAPLLNSIKQNAGMPLLTKCADYQKFLTLNQQSCFLGSTNASMIFEALCAQKSNRPIKNEFTKPIAIV